MVGGLASGGRNVRPVISAPWGSVASPSPESVRSVVSRPGSQFAKRRSVAIGPMLPIVVPIQALRQSFFAPSFWLILSEFGTL